ncbi:MAG TPA: hypothetical protein VKY85_16845 [Candidatus Angelobacter sp.]|nr:hypothetical protein [Candidatus Angelobacter sp.]
MTHPKEYPGWRESVGLHSTLEQDIRDYVADSRQTRRPASGKQDSFPEVPAASADYSESAALHRTEGIADAHYLQLADQMLKQGKYAPDALPKLRSFLLH